MKYIHLFIYLLLFLAGTAFADCEYNGKVYPEGTSIGPYVCVDNVWKER